MNMYGCSKSLAQGHQGQGHRWPSRVLRRCSCSEVCLPRSTDLDCGLDRLEPLEKCIPSSLPPFIMEPCPYAFYLGTKTALTQPCLPRGSTDQGLFQLSLCTGCHCTGLSIPHRFALCVEVISTTLLNPSPGELRGQLLWACSGKWSLWLGDGDRGC